MARSRRWQLVLLACVVALSLAWLAPGVADSARLNAGMVWLARAMLAQPGDSSRQSAIEAESWLGDLVRRAPGNGAAWRGLGLALAVQEREAEATEAWRHAPGMTEELLRRGKQAFVLERFEEALAWYERATRLAPLRAAAWYGIGRALQELEESEKALQAYRQVLDLADWSGIPSGSPHYRVASLDYRRGDAESLQRAWQGLAVALEVDALSDVWESADAHYLRGMILRQWGRPVEEYAGELEAAVGLQPLHAAARAQLGLAYYDRDGDLPEAEAQLRKAIATSPESGWMYLMLGDVYMREGMPVEATAVYQQAAQLPGAEEQAQWRLTELLQRSDPPGSGDRRSP